MTDTISATAPLYLCIALGFVLARLGFFAKTEFRLLGKFVIQVALPCLLLSSIASHPIAEILNPGYLTAYLLGSLGVLFLFYAASGRHSESAKQRTIVNAMGVCSSNSAFIGYPIVLATLGSVASLALALNMLVENLAMLPVLLVLAERVRLQSKNSRSMVRGIGKTLLQNPLIWAIVMGGVLSVFDLQLPLPVSRTIVIFSQSSVAVSLFVIGGSLQGVVRKGLFRRVSPIAFAKLVLHPLMVVLGLWFVALLGLPVRPVALRSAEVLLAAMPMMSIYPILAQPFGQEDVAAAALVVTTIASFLSLNFLLWLLSGFA